LVVKVFHRDFNIIRMPAVTQQREQLGVASLL